MHPGRRSRDHQLVRGALATVGFVIAAGCGALDPSSDSLHLAAHSTTPYLWVETNDCFRTGECIPEMLDITIDRARSSDESVVDTWFDDDDVMHLVTGDPGSAVLTLRGERLTRKLYVEVAEVDAFLFDDRRIVDDEVLLLPGARAAFSYVMLDEWGEPLEGALQHEVAASHGATVELATDRPLIIVTAPDMHGRFEVGLDDGATMLTADVIDEGEIDGIEFGDELAIPTVGGRRLGAGDVAVTTTPVDDLAPCEVDLDGWGAAPPIAELGDDVSPLDLGQETWAVPIVERTAGAPCELRFELPQANLGAGLHADAEL